MTEGPDPADGGFRRGPKMIYLARANPSLPPGAFPERWRQHGRFCHGIPVWNHLCHYEQCLALASSADDRPPISAPALAADWDGVGLIWFWSDEALSRAEQEPEMARLVEDERQTFEQVVAMTCLVTREVVLRDWGATNVKLISFVRRRAKTSVEEFRHHWGVHAGMLLGLPEADLVRKYVQNYAVADGEAPIGAFDGVTELGFETVESLAAFFRGDGYRTDVRVDEERFIEVGETISVLTDETLLLTDPLGEDKPLGQQPWDRSDQ